MFARKSTGVFVIAPVILFYLFSFQFNDWLSFTMLRHQIIQLPTMFLLGILLALIFPKWRIKDISWGISALIFIMASLIFWMLPHSVDFAVIYESFNRLMHLNMLVCGALLVASFRGLLFEIKVLFLGMISAKLIAVGIVFRVFSILLCSSFDIQQQKETGAYLIVLGAILFLCTFIVFFRLP